MNLAIDIPTLYVVGGLLTGTAGAVWELRGDARKGEVDPDVNGEVFAIGFFFWPFLLPMLVVCGYLDWFIPKLARIERIPEVQERRQKQLEKEVGID